MKNLRKEDKFSTCIELHKQKDKKEISKQFYTGCLTTYRFQILYLYLKSGSNDNGWPMPGNQLGVKLKVDLSSQ